MYIGMWIIGLILIFVSQNADTTVYRYKHETSSTALELLYGLVLVIGVVMFIVGGLNCVSGNWR